MKTKSLFIAVLVVFSSAIAFAGKDEPRSTGLAIISVKGTDVFKVVYKSAVTGKVRLNVYNAKGAVLFTESIFGDGFIRPLNFTGLSSGEYTIELIDASGRKVEKVSYNPESSLKQVHISKVGTEGKFLISITNKGKEDIKVSIYDSSNNLIHTESKSIDGDFAQVYKLASGTASYTFQVTDKSGNIKTIKF